MELVSLLAAFPGAGAIMAGTGGFRKLRFARQDEGKSGGFRVIYFFHCEGCPVYVTDIFAKNQKANLTKAERNALAEIAMLIKNTHR